MIYVTPVCFQGRYLTCFLSVKCLGLSKTLLLGFLRHHKRDKCQTLDDGTTHTLPVHYIFNDLGIILGSQQCQMVLSETLCSYLIKLEFRKIVNRTANRYMLGIIYHTQGD